MVSSSSDFTRTCASEPHAARREAILKAHPEVRALMGADARGAAIGAVLVVAQLLLATWASTLPLAVYLITLYVGGATLAQALFLAVHEATHDLFFRGRTRNRLFAMLLNIPLVVPFCEPFRAYHLEHHRHQGVVGLDADLPSELEARYARGVPGKLVWLALQLVAYALRPVLTRPRVPSRVEGVHALAQGVAMILLWRADAQALCFLVWSALIAGGLHPTSGHFLAEHHAPRGATQETYSYYGPLNWLAFNVGYHNEHHDFPRVPGTRLPMVRAAAPEFYAHLRTCESWPGALIDFVIAPDRSLCDRVVR